ncbi:hypothetical protein N2603_10190 [Bradyrhizobium huanghuaihaiense]|uniref:hypothetical protein n=1 Tax=Bradyrhizobium huanghuaihaiense TaxID=990078 RepID=UPI0021AA0036|nr:hypothetical protein [Bradyrhizobium sp. CB3035]UWU78798.1 hypothetical protein N2603_10190 [Bradyrhizobium sp. CB3035]
MVRRACDSLTRPRSAGSPISLVLPENPLSELTPDSTSHEVFQESTKITGLDIVDAIKSRHQRGCDEKKHRLRR